MKKVILGTSLFTALIASQAFGILGPMTDHKGIQETIANIAAGFTPSAKSCEDFPADNACVAVDYAQQVVLRETLYPEQKAYTFNFLDASMRTYARFAERDSLRDRRSYEEFIFAIADPAAMTEEQICAAKEDDLLCDPIHVARQIVALDAVGVDFKGEVSQEFIEASAEAIKRYSNDVRCKINRSKKYPRYCSIQERL